MDDYGKKILTAVAGGRILIGSSMLIAPQAAKGWLGDIAERQSGQAAVRMLGARDLVLGLGTLSALSADEAKARSWVDAAVAADLVDAAAAYLARTELPSPQRYVVYVAAGGAALAGMLFRNSARG